MNVESAVKKRIRVALAKDGRVRMMPNVVGLMIPHYLVRTAILKRDWSLLENANAIACGLGKGSSDLVGIVRGGRVIGLEVKTTSKDSRTSLEQDLWLATIRRWGGFATVVRSPEDAIAAVNRAVAGASE